MKHIKYLFVLFVVIFVFKPLIADTSDNVTTNPDDFETSNYEDEVYDPLEPLNRAIFSFNNLYFFYNFNFIYKKIL